MGKFVFGIGIGLLIAGWWVDWVCNERIGNMQTEKSVCQKNLPRDQECVMVYEFVPVKKESEGE